MKSNILNKDIILSQTTTENIYKKFLNLTEIPKHNISSPFSEDKKASFTLYKNGTFKCNSTGKQGDVWQLVADIKQLNCKQQFNEVLNVIATEMQLNCNTVATLQKQNIYEKSTETAVKTNIATELQQNCNDKTTFQNNNCNEIEPKKLTIEKREYTELDLKWWNNLGVKKETLEIYKVHSIKSYCWTGKKPIYTKNESVAFAFELQGQKKLYIPEQPTVGIKKNVLPAFKTGIFGFEQLGTEKKENIIICEGEKDTVTAVSRGLNAVCFGSATKTIKTEDIDLLQSHCNNLFICLDNDSAGVDASEKLSKRFKNITKLQLPHNKSNPKYDITDYFQSHTAQDFQKIIDLAVKNKSVVDVTKNENPTIFHIVEDYLAKKYDLRFNTIALDIEISPKNLNSWDICNENSLWIELQKTNIKVGLNALVAILKSDFVPKYNPIIRYFKDLPVWDKQTDYITKYSQYIILNPNEDIAQFEYHFKKWCVRAVKCAMINDYFNKQAFVLSDDGKSQNAGKTSWINFLCPDALQDFIKMDLPKDEKDAKVSLAKNIFINLDELANLSKQDVNGLKSLFSTPKIKVRLPYDKKDTVIQRVCSFIGSTNNSTFLSDETGSVRWLCFVLDKINWDYRKDFNVDNLWAQAYYLANDKTFDETFTKEDIIVNEKRNEKFQILTPEKEMIIKYFEKPTQDSPGEKMTTTEILNFINGLTTIRLNMISVGRALTSLKYEKARIKDAYCYLISKKYKIE
jgi:predicted P-loop ATPase